MGDQLITETITNITHKKQNRPTSMPSEGFKPMIPASKWLQTYTLNSAATGIVMDTIGQ